MVARSVSKALRAAGSVFWFTLPLSQATDEARRLE